MTDPEKTPPTFEELRALLPVKGIRYRGLYAGVAGTGPEGKTCHDCGWLTYTRHGNNYKGYPKCGKTAYTHGDATTIKTRTAACQHFTEPTS